MIDTTKKPATKSKAIVGAKSSGKSGSSQQSPTEQPDSLRSRAYAQIIDVVSEGQIKGLVNGFKSVYFDSVALQNADGTYNFDDVKVYFRDGSIGQPYLNTGSGIESTTDVSVSLKYNVPVVRSIISAETDLCRVAINVGALKKTSTTNGNVTGSSVSHLVEYRSNGGAWNTVKTDVITGKTSSGYQREVSFRLTGTAPWDVRVTRLTADSTSDALQNATSWSNITAVMEEKLRYPATALFGVQINAEQFSGIPTRAYHLDGLIIKVPSNYNPLTRAYTGSWDGTFKTAWTNNPAWCMYDLLTNTRYGLGDRIDAAMLDKWELYEIGRYCDQLVPDGRGGTEPRFTCNLYIQSRSEAYKFIQDMATVFRGISYWASGSIAISQDSPKPITYQFNNSNVENGVFERAGSNIKTRHNVALVTWNDPTDMYRQKVEYVEDFAAIEKMGYVSESEVVAFGCTSQGQAHRYGEWLLYTEQYESEVMTFTTGAEGAIPMPNDIIQVSDVYHAGERRGGRVLAGSTTSSIKLDSSVVLAVGKTYTLSIIDVDGAFQSKTVSSAAGTRSTVTVSTAFSKAIAENSSWILSDAALQPEVLRVVGVEEAEAGKYKIACLSHEPSKFDYIERNQTLQTPKTSNLSSIKPDVINVVIAEERYTGSNEIPMSRIAVSFQPANAASTAFFVEYKVGSGAWSKTATTSQHYAEIPFTAEGETYTIRVVAGNQLLGIWNSSPAEYTFTPAAYAVPAVTGLATATAWSTGKSIVLGWDELKGIPTFDLDVIAGGLVVRSVNVKGNSFVYTPQDMKADGGYWRTITFKVRARSSLGRTGAWASLACTNAQIGALQGLSIKSGIRQAFLSFTKPVDSDWAGVCVWIGTTANFTVSDTNKVFEGMTSLVNLTALADNSPLLPNVTYYLRAAGYDEFGKDGLAVSASMAFVVNGVVAELNSVAANMLENTLGSTIDLITAPASTSGSVNARVGSLSTASSTAVSAAKAAVASLSTAAAAAVNSNKASADAGIATAQTATASLSTATATSVANLTATVSTNKAATDGSITALSTLVVNGDAANASTINALSTSTNTKTASLSTSVIGLSTAVTTADAALGVRIDGVTASVNTTAASLSTSVYTAQTATASLSTATANSLASLNATVSTNKSNSDASVLTAQTATASLSTATAGSITTLSTTVSTKTTSLSTSVVTAQAATSSLSTATATSITNLTATISTNKSTATAGVSTSQAAVASLSTATANTLTTLTATVSTNKTSTDASIVTAQAAVASLSTATASSVATLQTSLNGNTASIQNQQTSINGLSAQWAIKTDVNGHVAGFALANTVNNGTPSSAFIVSAGAFGVAAPGKPAVYAFVIDTAKNTVGLNGTLLVDGTVAATAIVANSITAAQLAIKAVTADKIDVLNLSAISATLGNVSGGAFFGGSHTSGYTWPPSGGGFHLSAAGLLLGNANANKYFQVDSDGDMYAPGMKIENGVMTISQINVIDTSNIVNNAVTKVTSISSDAVAEVLTTSSGTETEVLSLVVVAASAAKLNIWSTFELSDVGQNSFYTKNKGYYRLLVDGVELISRDTIVPVGEYTSFAALDVVNVAAGSHTVQILAHGDYHHSPLSTMRSRYRRMVCLLSYK